MTNFSYQLETRAFGLAISADGVYILAVTPWGDNVYAYKKTNGVFNRITFPIFSGSYARDVACTSDGVYWAIAHASGNYVSVYKRTGDTFTQLSLPAAGVRATSVAFSSSGTHLAVTSEGADGAGSATTKFTVYSRSGDSFSVIFTDNGGSMYGGAYSPDGAFFAAAHTGASGVRGLRTYAISGSSYTRTDYPSFPMATYGCTAFSPDSQLLAVSWYNGTSILKLSGSTWSLYANLTTEVRATRVQFTSDGTRILTVDILPSGVPLLRAYSVGDGPTFTLLAGPEVVPAFTNNSVFSTNYSPDAGVGLAICAANNSMQAIITQDNFTGIVFVVYEYNAVNQLPQGGYVDRAAPVLFSWDIDTGYSALFSETQAAAKFRWRVKGAGSYTEINVPGSTKSYTLAANTLPADSLIEWQVLVQSTSGAWTTNTEAWLELTTTDSTPQAAVPLAPVSEYVDVDQPVVFSWSHVIDTATAQTQADLEYAVGTGSFSTLATVVGANQSVTISAGTLPAGQIRWRVRTYNSASVVGPWSAEAVFVGTGTPAMPSITGISQSNRPTVNWQSAGQVSFRLVLQQSGATLLDTGEMAGTKKTFKVPDYLSNGSYTVRIAIKNASMRWSAFASMGFTLAVTGPATPTLTATATQDGAVLMFSGLSVYSYLLRDGVPVADITGLTSYTDYAALGLTTYVVRTVDANDNYTDSETAYVTVSVSAPTLAAVDALSDMVPLKLTRGEPRRMTGDFSQAVTYQYFAGRAQPVATFAGQESEAYQLPVAFIDNTEYKRLMALLRRRKPLLYRDNWGNRWYCVAPALGSDQDHLAVTVTLSMTVVGNIGKIAWR